MIAIVDYGVGNLRSVQKAMEHVGVEGVVITSDKTFIREAQGVILPGVGAFEACINNLRAARLEDVVLETFERDKPLLGICVGMQILFEVGEEMGTHRGLGILPGRVVRFPAGLKVPHIGWNQIRPVADRTNDCSLLDGIRDGDFAYFVHSYYPICDEEKFILATTDYGIDFASVVGRGRLFGIQFHPEKSQDVGLRILKNFAKVVGQE